MEHNENIFQMVFAQQASFSVRVHALYAIIVLGMSQSHVAYIFGKGTATVCRWVQNFRQTGTVERKGVAVETRRFRKLMAEHRAWFSRYPLSYLHEISAEFFKTFGFQISQSSIFRILEEKSNGNK
eukprot:Pompholyxophrys_punicea_v1_NODE_997_length_1054_cov_4.767358.p2 type:complete len:126 gc:universal NODE_997_length_1054_cov_4.767358:943-566(-)